MDQVVVLSRTPSLGTSFLGGGLGREGNAGDRGLFLITHLSQSRRKGLTASASFGYRRQDYSPRRISLVNRYKETCFHNTQRDCSWHIDRDCIAQATIVSEPPEPEKNLRFADVALQILRQAIPVVLIVAAAGALALGLSSNFPSSFSSLSLTQSSSGGFTKVVNDLLCLHCAPIVKSAYTGLAAGCLHTLTGPDHLAALAPLTIGRSRIGSAVLGALWGGGHGTGQLLLGAVFVLFKEQLTHAMPLLSRWSSTLVGLTLIAIGAHGLKEAWALHSGAEEVEDIKIDSSGRLGVNVATYCNGVVFGLQPDALLVVLPALALPSKAASAMYILTFLVGTVAAMGTYTAFIGAATRSLGQRPLLRLSFISGLLALCLGGVFVFNNTLLLG
eukprot:TRINITY_DN1322_c0_g1_i1.p1 TRINITY_DN1322_c0_g1~~TRINITY_DN1322_c0_g1_i1.p1  ORF type:complete len:388 (-),score=37.87 TRINITY_DN1322_c0_g1_i1:833-1996(-)